MKKLVYLKFIGDNSCKTSLTDKVLVRDWVKKKIGDKYLVPILGIYNKFDDINFQELPSKFVIKCNHDSGSTVICEDKSKLDLKQLKQKYEFWLKRNYAYTGYEMNYKNIIPQIIIEKYMGKAIRDYKFLCFDGKIYYCWIDFDRFENHKRNVYDLDWNLQPFKIEYENYDGQVKCPEKFEEMKEIVEKLSKGFDHVRVDLYYINEEIYFGEMTFASGNGFDIISPEEWDYKIGDLWNFDYI